MATSPSNGANVTQEQNTILTQELEKTVGTSDQVGGQLKKFIRIRIHLPEMQKQKGSQSQKTSYAKHIIVFGYLCVVISLTTKMIDALQRLSACNHILWHIRPNSIPRFGQ